MIVLKFISLVIAIWFTYVNIIRMVYKQKLPAINFIIQAVAITTFIFIQWDLF